MCLTPCFIDPEPFTPWPEAEGQWTCREAVTPIDVMPLRDLIQRHREAGIELRFVANLWPFWDDVVQSGLPFSGVRLSNAAPRG